MQRSLSPTVKRSIVSCPMRILMAILLVGIVCLLGACSYMTDFVIVNKSDGPITIRYEVKEFPGPFYPPEAPAVVAASELSEDGQQWNLIKFEVDEASRSVTTHLLPGQAFRLATLHKYAGHDDPVDAEKFQIRRIILSGTRGELVLADQQARTAFTKVARTLYTLTYE